MMAAHIGKCPKGKKRWKHLNKLARTGDMELLENGIDATLEDFVLKQWWQVMGRYEAMRRLHRKTRRRLAEIESRCLAARPGEVI
jgi:hypothetical protein